MIFSIHFVFYICHCATWTAHLVHFESGEPDVGKTPLYRRLGGPQGRSGRVRKISPPPEFDPRSVQPEASRYTDWAIPAPWYRIVSYRIFSYRLDSPVREPHLFASAFLGRKCLSMFNAIWKSKIVVTADPGRCQMFICTVRLRHLPEQCPGLSVALGTLRGALCNVKNHVLRKQHDQGRDHWPNT